MLPLAERLHAPTAKERIAAAIDAGRQDVLAAEDARALLATTGDAEPGVRWAALTSVGQLIHRNVGSLEVEAERRALTLASDPTAEVRAEAAVVLALVSPKDPRIVRAALLTLLEDEEAIVRREAAAALGDLGDAGAAPPLATHLLDTDAETRFEAAFALGSLKDARGLSQLLAALGEPRRRLDALEGLRRLGSQEAIEPIERLGRKRFLPWPDRLTVSATLYALGERGASAYLISRLTAFSREERQLAIGMIASHRVVEAREALERIAGDPKNPLQESAGDALRALEV